MIAYKFNPRLFIFLILGFVFCTIIGTLTHELGHYIVAKSLGYEARVFYGSMEHFPKGYKESDSFKELIQLNERYGDQIFDSLDVSIQNRYKNVFNQLEREFPTNSTKDMLVTLGGPVQTLLTSIFGLLILWFRKSKFKTSFQILDWIGIFCGLFVLREVFNTLMALFSNLINEQIYFSGDEFRISLYFGLNQWIVPLLTMIYGLGISLYIIFKVIPASYRLTFILAGLVGSFMGFGIWFGFLGEQFLPVSN